MPQVFKVSGYLVFLWTDEGKPLEPIHFHMTDGVPSENCTKVWLTSRGHCMLCHNKSRIPEEKLHRIMRIANRLKRNGETISEKSLIIFDWYDNEWGFSNNKHK